MPQVPSTVAYSAGVVGAAPAHLKELVKKEKEEEKEGEATATMRPGVVAPSASSPSPSPSSPPDAVVGSAVAAAVSSSAKGMKLNFRAVPALEFVAIEVEEGKEGEVEREEDEAA